MPELHLTPRNIIVISLVVGLVARVLVSVFYTFINDINYWIVVSNNLTSNESLYELPGYYYSPAWGYFMAVFTAVANLLGIPYGTFEEDMMSLGPIRDWSTVIPSLEYSLLLKACLIAADILVGYLIYRIGTHMTDDPRKGAMMFMVWFLCPLTIVMSCDRLMFENVEILFFLLSFYMMLMNRPVEAGLAMGVSLMLKPYGMFLALLMIAFAVVQSGSLRYAGKYVASAAVSVLIIMLPAILNGELAEAAFWFSSRADSISSGYNFTILFVPVLILVALMFSATILKYKVTDARTVFLLATIPTAGMMLIPGNIQYYLVLVPFIILAPGHRGYIPMILLAIMGFFALFVHLEADSLVYLNTGLPGGGFLEWMSDTFSFLENVDYGRLKTLSAFAVLLAALYTLYRRVTHETA